MSVGVPVDHDEAQVIATLSFSAGRLRLSSAFRSRSAALWASWADCMRMVRQRHPNTVDFMLTNLAEGASPCFVSVRGCQQSLVKAGLEMPSRAELSESAPVLEENTEPNQPNVGWEHKAVRQVEKKFIHEEVWPTLDDPQRALMRSQRGPLASAPLSPPRIRSGSCSVVVSGFSPFPCAPADVAANLTLWPSSRGVPCGRGLGKAGLLFGMRCCSRVSRSRGIGHDQHVCSRHGGWVFGREGFALESTAAGVGREAGARVGTNLA